MNADKKERLIDLVRENKCLYCTKNRNYKNKIFKNTLWDQIGASLGLSGAKAKETWRTLRDGYIRYKKSALGLNDSSRKYSHYTWSSQMAFLDDYLVVRSAKTEPGEPAPPPETSPGPAPSPSPPPLSPLSLSTLLQQPQPPPVSCLPSTYQLPSLTPRPPKRRNASDSSDIGLEHTDLDNLRELREWDSVDYLFMSYAKSFKKLSLRRQITMKVELAKLFADAELEEAVNFTNQINIRVSEPVIKSE